MSEDRLARLEAALDAQQRQIDHLRAENAVLRREPSTRSSDAPSPAPPGPVGRRALLTKGLAVAGAATGGAVLLSAEPVAAADGQPQILGGSNTATSFTTLDGSVRIDPAGTTTLALANTSGWAVDAKSSSSTAIRSSAPIGVRAEATAADGVALDAISDDARAIGLRSQAGVVTPHPFALGGADRAADLWTVAARPAYVAFQVLWLVAVVARWRTSGRVVPRQLTVVGAAVAASLVALALGLVVWATPTAGVLAVGLVPIAAGWAIVHEQTLTTHSALTWLSRRSDDDDALPAELAEAIADEHVVIWARRDDNAHTVGVWPEPAETIVPISDVDLAGIAADGPATTVRAITREGTQLGAVVVERPQPHSRHDERLLDGFCGEARLDLEHLAAPPALTGRTSRSIDGLTPRELEVLDFMAKGLTNAAICEHLHLSIKAVEPAVSSVFTKLDLPPGRESNRRVLAVLAYVDHQRVAAVER